jgi:hypothetical protein
MPAETATSALVLARRTARDLGAPAVHSGTAA